MKSLYNIGIWGYSQLVKAAGINNPKAHKWVEGRKAAFPYLQEHIKDQHKICWFHVSSLGEFEQARPVIEAIKKEHPDFKVLVTFFSPSGYEVRKNYEQADYICYLPTDTPKNVTHFLDIVNPELVFFVKYEFWYHYLTQLKKRAIPTYIFSAIFRPNQLFFKPWGKWYLKALHAFDHLFVQNHQSLDILNRHGFSNVTLSGDTRFDRVGEIADSAPTLSKLEKFGSGQKVFVAGSTWKPDEELLIKYINETTATHKFVIAPHEVSEQSLQRITSALQKPYAFYSNASNKELAEATVLIADGYGYLTSIYRYGKVAYVGGGFGVGIHNILEAATFGMPILFGPNFMKFQEAHDLIERGGAFPVEEYSQFKSLVDAFLSSEEKRSAAAHIAESYVKSKRGSARQVMNLVFGA